MNPGIDYLYQVYPTWMIRALATLLLLIACPSAHAVVECIPSEMLSPKSTRTRTQELGSPLRIEQRRVQSSDLAIQTAARNGLHLAILDRSLDRDKASGDFYRVFTLRDGRVALLVGDVSGKGERRPTDLHGSPMPGYPHTAAEVTMWIHGIFEGRDQSVYFGDGSLSASEVMTAIDLELERVFAPRFALTTHLTLVSMSLVIIDPTTGRLEYANSGLPYLRIRKVDGSIQELIASGHWMGDDLFNYRSDNSGTTYAQLNPGETVVLNTDGIEDSLDKQGKPLIGQISQALSQADRGSPAQFLGILREANAEQHDDITVFAFQFKP